MRYALNLGKDGRVLSVTEPKYAPADVVVVSDLPEGDVYEYRYANGYFIHDPLPAQQEKPSYLDVLEAQLAYTAMMTDTLLEV